MLEAGRFERHVERSPMRIGKGCHAKRSPRSARRRRQRVRSGGRSVRALHLFGFDRHMYFSAHALARSQSDSRGEGGWVAAPVWTRKLIGARESRLTVLLPRFEKIGPAATGAAVVAAMVLLVTLSSVSLSFSPRRPTAAASLGPRAVRRARVARLEFFDDARAGCGCRDGDDCSAGSGWGDDVAAGRADWVWRCWFVVAVLFAFVSGWLSVAGARPLAGPGRRSDVVRIGTVAHVGGTPVRVRDVSSWTNQANAFTVGFGPAARVVVWNTLLDGRFRGARWMWCSPTSSVTCAAVTC